jgi:hypothetical protein
MHTEQVKSLDDAQQRGEEIIRSAWASGFTLESQLKAMSRLIDQVHFLAAHPEWTGRHVTFNDGTGKRIGGVVTREPWGRGQNISIKSDDGRTFTRLMADVAIDREQQQ